VASESTEASGEVSVETLRQIRTEESRGEQQLDQLRKSDEAELQRLHQAAEEAITTARREAESAAEETVVRARSSADSEAATLVEQAGEDAEKLRAKPAVELRGREDEVLEVVLAGFLSDD
jgi:vacuolar-type H+-ATPase subunit H